MAEAQPPHEEGLNASDEPQDSVPYTKETTCPVCHNLMSSPMQLSCKDSMCHACVGTDLNKVVENDIVHCPVCGEECSVPSGGIRKMRNHNVERLLEIRSVITVDVTGMVCQDPQCGKRPQKAFSDDEDGVENQRQESSVGRLAMRMARMGRGEEGRPQPAPPRDEKGDYPSGEDDVNGINDGDAPASRQVETNSATGKGADDSSDIPALGNEAMPGSSASARADNSPLPAEASMSGGASAARGDNNTSSPLAADPDTKAVEEYCLTCQLYLCLRCSQYHDEEDQPHATIPLRELTDEERRTVAGRHPPRCFDHPEVLYSLYCKDCKECLCTTCVEVEDHDGHNILDLKVAAEESRQNIKRIHREVEEYQRNLSLVIAESDANFERANRDIEMMRQMIIDQVQRLQDHIHQQEREMLAMIDRRRAASRFRRGDQNQGRKL